MSFILSSNLKHSLAHLANMKKEVSALTKKEPMIESGNKAK